MIIIINDGKIHSTYNDDKAGILFSMFSLSEIEYVSTPVEIGQPLPPRTAEQMAADNEKMRGLAYTHLTDKLYIKSIRKNDSTIKTEADALVAQIKVRWPK